MSDDFQFHKHFVFGVKNPVLEKETGKPTLVRADDEFSLKAGYGFVTEEVRKQDERYSIPESSNAFVIHSQDTDSERTDITDSAEPGAEKYVGFRRAQAGIPQYFLVRVPHSGNYTVDLTIGSSQRTTEISVFTERRRCVLWRTRANPGEFLTVSFTANVCGMIPRGKNREYEDLGLDITLVGEGAYLSTAEIRESPGSSTVYLAGDSTVTDQPADIPYSPADSYCGWGQMLPAFLKSGIAVSNHAHSGLTTEGFFQEGHWSIVNREIKPKDYVLIQFGHNDQKLKTLDAYGGYAENLRKFIRITRERGGRPILISPVSRALWNAPGGKFNDLLAQWADACGSVAKEMKVPFVDLHQMSMRFFLEQGSSRSSRFFHPGDHTHFNDFGGYLIASFVAREFKKIPEMAGCLREGYPKNEGAAQTVMNHEMN